MPRCGWVATAESLADGVRTALSGSVFSRSLRDNLLGTMWTLLATGVLYALFRVKIADTVGDVVERGMLVTRLRTPKNVEVTTKP